MKDPIEGLADLRLIELAVDLQVQLEKGTGTRPVLFLLNQQRGKAVDAIMKMVDIDVSETVALRSLQAEVRLYSDLIQSCRALLSRGRDADRKISEANREDLEMIVATPEERQLYGLQPQGID
jgi:hypothetical protein